MRQFIDISQSVQAATLYVKGPWDLEHVSAIQVELKDFKARDISGIQSDVEKLDTAGALLLLDVIKQTGQTPDNIQNLQDWQLALLKLVGDSKEVETEKAQPDDIFTRFFVMVGKKSVSSWNGLLDLLRFIGETVVTLGILIKNPGRIRMVSIVRHIYETGIAAIPIVALIAFLISIVLAYQGANQLQRFGAEIFTINMVAVSVLREMGVLLTAIMVAGRSGSAFTAEIGVMKVNEEVDAMQIIGVKPFEILVLPRLLALMITLPLLTFVADLMGLLGGGIISHSLLNIEADQYLDRFKAAVSMKDFWAGMIKAPVFAFFIAVVGCMRGMQVSGSAESVGRLTTVSVVQSIFLVLLLDALFSILFTKLGI